MIGPAPPGVDLAWYLAVNSARLPVPKKAAIACFRRELERRLGNRFDEQWWQPQLELSLLGGFLQLGWAKVLGAARARANRCATASGPSWPGGPITSGPEPSGCEPRGSFVLATTGLSRE